MATRKKKQPTRKPLVKQVIAAVKAKPKVRAKTKAKKRERRAAPRPAFLSSIVALQAPDGRWAVHISTSPDEPIDRLAVTVNGRAVWEGQP